MDITARVVITEALKTDGVKAATEQNIIKITGQNKTAALRFILIAAKRFKKAANKIETCIPETAAMCKNPAEAKSE